MKNTALILTIISIYSFWSCNDKMIGAGYKDMGYYIYISGDSNTTANLSYLERKPGIDATDNHIISEQVTLPFSKAVSVIDHAKNNKAPDCFLEICKTTSPTTKAIIYVDALSLPDTNCALSYALEQTQPSENCMYCVNLSKDSVLNLYKQNGYPCYMEFVKGDACKKVRMHDWWYK